MVAGVLVSSPLNHGMSPYSVALPLSHSTFSRPAAQVKETATRMLTNFSVQASVNDFFTAQRIFKESGTKALPQVRIRSLSAMPFATVVYL